MLITTSIALDSAETARWRHELAAETELEGVEIVADELLPKMIGNSTQRDYPEILNFLRLMVRENAPAGVAAMLRALAARKDPSGILSHVHCPLICVAGEEDVLTPPDACLAFERIRGALTQRISQAGHLPNLERPEVFNDLLVQFMAEFTPA